MGSISVEMEFVSEVEGRGYLYYSPKHPTGGYPPVLGVYIKKSELPNIPQNITITIEDKYNRGYNENGK